MNQPRKRLLSKELHLVYLAGILCALLWINTGVHAQTPARSFSADEVRTFSDGKTRTGKVYATENSVRLEEEVGGKKTVSITRFDRKVMWLLEPDDQTYAVLHPNPSPLPPRGTSIQAPDLSAYMVIFNLFPGFTEFAHKFLEVKVERESLGSEKVGPYNCDKFQVRLTLRQPAGGFLPRYKRNAYTRIEWAAKELGGFVVKGQDEGGETDEYQNIQLGPQDPSLFEIPKGYRKKLETYATCCFPKSK